jgi:hypothetical protein
MRKVWAWMLLATLSTHSTGCYKWVEIKPTEVVKLNGSYRRDLGSVSTPSGTVTTTEVTVAHVERPDGTLVELKGDFDADITEGGSTSRFEHPVNSRIQGPFLVVASGNRAATPYIVKDIRKVEIKQYDSTTSNIVLVVGGLAGGLLLAGMLVSSAE